MTDFDLQRRLRQLPRECPPQADLWPGIAARIAAESRVASSPWRRRLPFAIAAALMATLGLGWFGLVLRDARQPAAPAVTAMPMPAPISPREAAALARRAGTDPQLVGAGRVLDAAEAELRQAMRQNPDSPLLAELLQRTEARRQRLARQTPSSPLHPDSAT